MGQGAGKSLLRCSSKKLKASIGKMEINVKLNSLWVSFPLSFKVRLPESRDSEVHLTLSLKGNGVMSKVVLATALYNRCSQQLHISIFWHPFLLETCISPSVISLSDSDVDFKWWNTVASSWNCLSWLPVCIWERGHINMTFTALWDWPLVKWSESRTGCHWAFWQLINKSLMISCLLPSVLLNLLWMEIYSKSDFSMPNGLELTLLSSHLPGSDS